MLIKIIFLLFFNVSSVWLLFVAPVPKHVWQERCHGKSLALNDCNWCRCDNNAEYQCTARICDRVDMFGHFNDALTQFDVGMEGHGVWRSTEDQCTKGVHYRKGEILCVCTEDGNWPNPVCRDAFQVLHSVKPTKYKKANNQTCLPSKLYQVGCNVCYCPSRGIMNPDLCTKRNCNDEDKESKKLKETIDNILPVQVYATCIRGKVYKINCQTCMCLPNNRLLCDNCTDININDLGINSLVQLKEKENKNGNNLCSERVSGKLFKNKCNTCHCNNKGIIYCTVLKCLELDYKISIPEANFQQVNPPIDDNECISMTKYKKGCNTCQCFVLDGIKYFACTVKTCHNDNQTLIINLDCVENTRYEKNCLICQCVTENGIKREICSFNDRCKMEGRKFTKNPTSLEGMHGYCEPLHRYYMDCNICKCLSNGQIVACTSKICPNKDGILVEFVPFMQKQAICPSGYSYRVDCNVCKCLSNGNALCTTKRCDSNEIKSVDDY